MTLARSYFRPFVLLATRCSCADRRNNQRFSYLPSSTYATEVLDYRGHVSDSQRSGNISRFKEYPSTLFSGYDCG